MYLSIIRVDGLQNEQSGHTQTSSKLSYCYTTPATCPNQTQATHEVKPVKIQTICYDDHMVSKSQRSPNLSNFFGSVGYLSIISQWLWTIALLLPLLLKNGSFKQLVLPNKAAPTQTPGPVFDENSFIMIAVAVIVTALVLIVTVVILIKLPLALIRTSKKSVDTVVETIIPTITHHKPVSKEKKAILSVKVRIYIKLFVCIVPITPLIFVGSDAIGLDQAIALLIGAALALGTVFWFTLQYASAKLLKLPLEKLL